MACEREYERCLCLRGLVCYLAIAVLCWRVASAPATSSGQAPGTCISQGGRFPRFIHDGKLPRKSSKGPNDLTLCRIYTKNTCCTSSQTRAAMNSLRRLASNGEANNTCLELWEVLECAICDPRVGTKPGPPVICSSFCESIFTACADAFFAMDPTSQQVLMPCGPKDTICARAKEWTMNASAFCQILGFSLRQSKDELDASCFDGRTDVESKGFSTTTGRATQNKDGILSSHEDFLAQGQKDMGEKILWAIGGLVLTAAAACWRYRRSKSRQKRAALFRNIQEARARQQAASNAATSKAVNKSAKKF
ncbi:hypothetical protein O6H91_01G053800 [Diphasiastrum complanatum]|uniref:Uncharacterized protein n=1 Tax=Diphasiastrum complanatum TaxID=34168 RepID=A0ACC2ER03_DIPCM|nr:hypothetical protein O6H91_01G053800 [Diphasiastrum complanatum]